MFAKTLLMGILIACGMSRMSGGVHGMEGDPVVIRASFRPQQLLCEVDVDAQTDGFGQWGMDAPCQRVSETPFHPECWQEPEENCLIVFDEGFLDIQGDCHIPPPCSLEHAFSIVYREYCGTPCDQVKCCSSEIVRVTSGGYHLGYIYNDGVSLDVSAVDECQCLEADTNTCKLEVQIGCSYGLGYLEMTKFGYYWRCVKCA